jgi:DNA repair protein RadC
MSGCLKSWPEYERPRERIYEQGIEALSDAELLAILLRNGIKGKDAVALARELLAQFGGLRGLFAARWKELNKVKGLGPAKISTLLAAQEIARRKFKEEIVGKNVIQDPASVMNYLYHSLRDRKKEIFKVLFLNKANCILGERDLFEGTVDETAIHPREVIEAALDRRATALILVHNHPSGRIQPSEEDIAMTRKLQTSCDAVSIKILDHLIVGDNQYFSFKENHLL